MSVGRNVFEQYDGYQDIYQQIVDAPAKGHWRTASEYYALHPPVQDEACANYVPPQPPPEPTREQKEAWKKNPQTRYWAKPQSDKPRVETISQELREELIASNRPASPEEKFIDELQRIAWKSAKQTLSNSWKNREHGYNHFKRMQESKAQIMVVLFGCFDRLWALPPEERYPLAKAIAMNTGRDFSKLGDNLRLIPATQYGFNEGRADDEYDPSTQDLQDLADENSFANQEGFDYGRDNVSRAWDHKLLDVINEGINYLPEDKGMRLAMNLWANPMWWPDIGHPSQEDIAESMSKILGQPKTIDQVRYLLTEGTKRLSAWYQAKGFHRTTEGKLMYGREIPRP